jgi:1-aminocyclopropane-1-carboxylate deaminase
MQTNNVLLQQLALPFETEIKLHVLRLDLIDPVVSGNKWFKLKKNISQVQTLQKKGMITFGGAYSNHIAATAKACHLYGLQSIGIIRGDEVMNHTLNEAQANGMKLIFVDRNLYRDKAAMQQWLMAKFDTDAYVVVPEGGANEEGIIGCTEITSLINIQFESIAVACGTGTTLAGIIRSLAPSQTALGFAAMKGGEFLNHTIKSNILFHQHQQFKIITDFHFGGYAKCNNQLLGFMCEFKEQYHFELDFVYTAKMMYGLFQMIKQQHFAGKQSIIAIHSGGLQGNRSINI